MTRNCTVKFRVVAITLLFSLSAVNLCPGRRDITYLTYGQVVPNPVNVAEPGTTLCDGVPILLP